MILSLDIEDFVLIDKATVDFSNGLNVISGESGAGKSLIVNAISFILGERADKSFIRVGKQRARIQAVFDISKNQPVKNALNDLGIDYDDNLIISRTICFDGKSEIRVNGNIINLNMLKSITSFLMDICGQHEHQLLLKPENHLKFVDLYAGEPVLKLKQQLELQIAEFKKVDSNIKMLCGANSLEREIDMLRYQLNELQNADLKVGEDEELLDKIHKMQNVQKVSECVSQVNDCIMGKDAIGALNLLADSKKSLGQLCAIDKGFEELYSRLDSACLEIEDIVESCNNVLGEYEWNEHEFNKADERLELIKSLKRKYGNSIEDILQYKEDIEKKLLLLENSEETLNGLLNEKQKLLSSIYELCDELTILRKKAADDLSKNVKTELAFLGMSKANLSAFFKKNDDFSLNGTDEFEFLFSANSGQPPKPLSKIISGGEMSRFMLAFKVVMGAKNLVPSMLFDEIDSGVGGETGFAVSSKLFDISKSCQVLAVTHLSSIGAMADNHILVKKVFNDENTTTSISTLTNEERLYEIARLSGGGQIDSALKYANDLLCKANEYKNTH